MTDIEKQELLPCPWCDNKPMLTEVEDFWPMRYHVTCRTPTCHGDIFKLGGIVHFKTQELATQSWNTRTESAELLSARERIREFCEMVDVNYLSHKEFYGKVQSSFQAGVCEGMKEIAESPCYKALKGGNHVK